MHRRGSVFLSMSIWDAAVVHSDCIFPYPLQCPGHKDIMWWFVSISLHLRSSRRFHGLLQKQDTRAPVVVYMCSVLQQSMSHQPGYKTGSWVFCRPSLTAGGVGQGISLSLSLSSQVPWSRSLRWLSFFNSLSPQPYQILPVNTKWLTLSNPISINLHNLCGVDRMGFCTNTRKSRPWHGCRIFLAGFLT